MVWWNLKPSDRDFITRENNRIIEQMNNNAEYMAMNQSLEAAKSRMNDAILAMKIEDNPEKKARLAELANRYADEALAIQENWEAEVKAGLRAGRRIKVFIWLFVIFVFTYAFPVNLIIIALFLIWLYRNYIVLKSVYHVEDASKTKKVENTKFSKKTVTSDADRTSKVEISAESQYENFVNYKVLQLQKDKDDWVDACKQEIAEVKRTAGESVELDGDIVLQGYELIQKYRDILDDIDKLPDSNQKTYLYDHHKNMIVDLEDLLSHVSLTVSEE